MEKNREKQSNNDDRMTIKNMKNRHKWPKYDEKRPTNLAKK